MKLIVAAPLAAAVAWVVTPIVDLAVRGTIDSRTVAGWRTESAPALPPSGGAGDDVELPGQRRSPENDRTVTG